MSLIFGTRRSLGVAGDVDAGVPEDITIVDPGNGSGTDYLTLADWEAGEQADLTAAGVIAVAECRSSGGPADQFPTTIAGWTTSESNFIIVRAADGQEHNGIWSTDKYRLTGSAPFQLAVNQQYTKIQGIQLGSTGNTPTVIFGSNTEWARVLCNCMNAASTAFFVTGTSPTTFKNCIGFDVTVAVYLVQSTSGTTNIFNCTAASFGSTGFQIDSGTGNAKNCLADGSGSSDFDPNSDWGNSDFNASGDATAPGDNSRINQTFTFVDAANNDYHLDSGDTGAKGHGTDLSAEGFSDDIDGDTRGATWDIGADQVTGV